MDRLMQSDYERQAAVSSFLRFSICTRPRLYSIRPLRCNTPATIVTVALFFCDSNKIAFNMVQCKLVFCTSYAAKN